MPEETGLLEDGWLTFARNVIPDAPPHLYRLMQVAFYGGATFFGTALNQVPNEETLEAMLQEIHVFNESLLRRRERRKRWTP